jgi:hypothetical protein
MMLQSCRIDIGRTEVLLAILNEKEKQTGERKYWKGVMDMQKFSRHHDVRLPVSKLDMIHAYPPWIQCALDNIFGNLRTR